MSSPDYILRGNGLYLPRGYDLSPPPPRRQLEFFAYETVVAAAEPSPKIWWLPGGDLETHRVVAYMDQYEAQLMDHVEELLMQQSHSNDRCDYASELVWQREVARRRRVYYDKLGL